jgi:hypothetical protein
VREENEKTGHNNDNKRARMTVIIIIIMFEALHKGRGKLFATQSRPCRDSSQQSLARLSTMGLIIRRSAGVLHTPKRAIVPYAFGTGLADMRLLLAQFHCGATIRPTSRGVMSLEKCEFGQLCIHELITVRADRPLRCIRVLDRGKRVKVNWEQQLKPQEKWTDMWKFGMKISKGIKRGQKLAQRLPRGGGDALANGR